MKKISLQIIIAVFIFISYHIHAQSTVSLGLEGFVTNDQYQIHDQGNNLTSVPLLSIAGGATVRKELTKRIFIEGALTFKTYWEGYTYKNSGVYGSNDALYAFLLSCRFGYKIPIAKGFSIVPGAAAILGINTDSYIASGRSIGYGTLRANGSTMKYRDDENGDVWRFFPMVEPRVAIEKIFGEHFVVSAHYSRSFGVAKVVHLDIEYIIDNGAPQKAQAISHGDFTGIGLNVAYRIANKNMSTNNSVKADKPEADEHRTSFGFKAGLNRSVINGKELDGTATGYIGIELYAAFFAETELNKNWRFENELLYSFTDEYHFLEIPIHLKYLLLKKSLVFGGPKLDVIINNDNEFYDFNNFGISIELGAQYEITSRIICEIRYSNGLLPQVNDFVLDIYDGKRNTLRLGLGFRF